MPEAAVPRRIERAAAVMDIAPDASDLGDVDPATAFDVIFAINVNVFWTSRATREIGAMAERLRPGGAMYLCFELPAGRAVDPVADAVLRSLDDAPGCRAPRVLEREPLLVVHARKASL